MKTLDNVERISTPTPDTLYRDYVLTSRPVIITDLFDDQPVRALDTSVKARDRIPGLPVVIQPNYMTALLDQGTTGHTRRTTLAHFLDQIEADPATDDYCVEYPTPRDMNALIRPTEQCRIIDPDDIRSLMFVAAPGNFAHLHYDGDQRHVLMYQVFGRKRYSVIDARAVGKVAPLSDPTMQRTSSIFVQNFTEDDKLAFLRYANAWDCLLEPGETLLMPMMAWHYVEYLDASMSVSYRLGRNRFNRFLAEAIPIPSVFLQRLSVEFVDEDAVDAERQAAFERLQALSRQPFASGEERARALDRCCLQLCDRLDREWGREYTIFDRQRRELLAEAPAAKESAPVLEVDGNGAVTPNWRDEDAVSLAPEVMVMSPITDDASGRSTVLLARHGRLELKLTIDDRRPWVLDLLRLVATPNSTHTVAGLAAACGTEAADLRPVLAQLHERGWVSSAPAV